MRYVEIPSDGEVVETLAHMDGVVTAEMLCDELAKTHLRRDCQLAIQRAVERGRIVVDVDWKLSVAKDLAAA